ncbi:MAG: homoserine O-succinyltransferase [Mangrovibacterium sp.]
MPLNIPDKLPAIEALQKENIFVIDESRASSQDIRPLKIAILNLMPLKISTETDFLRVLSNTPLQITIDFLKIKNHTHNNTSADHMLAFYKTFDEIKGDKYDGLIITGAPVEHLNYEDVLYWDELKEIMDWSITNVTSSLFVCWASQAALHHFYGIPKYLLEQKKFGIYNCAIKDNRIPIFRGFDDFYQVPHSRHTEVRKEDIEANENLEVISESEIAGVNLVMSKDGRQFFASGHSEYARRTLDAEYKRDLEKGLDIQMPENYYPNNDSSKKPILSWRSGANLLFTNWLNYYVYQKTPFNIGDIK